eukprot:CAMPEP_0183602572 /NCGR_PEP_ID=MMETSP0371-20130417/181012_1 /TAXON_ID=268820 /ORGANISM="Peridinium aciculiferum, Strain PAER-2" /LENGTH=657 /DNA_ID=CAMNT_0025814667 /DNA_START=64 /DNA_END=2038 /DNA_ORIENTATION=+
MATTNSQQSAVLRATTAALMKQPPVAGVPIEKSQNPLQAASLTFKDLGFTASMPNGQSKTILEPCSGHFEPGQLVAIMGPSGCGKSTLLDMLAMKKTSPYDGEVLVNGQSRDPVLFRRIAAYVGQEDCMPAHWKVREALEFNANLKRQHSAKGSSRRNVGDFIDNLLEAFGLTGVADTYIGGAQVRGISGGQRRRVTLAHGVASQASILFCDEPTSGLSATDAELCVKALRVVAKRLNVLVLVVIHQRRKEVAKLFDTLVLLTSNPGRMAYCGPMAHRKEVAKLFDTLVLLTSNPGRMAYCGPMAQASSYISACGCPIPGHVNPTDLYLDLLTPGAELDVSDALVAAFAERQKPELDKIVDEAFAVRGQTSKEMLLAAHEQKGMQGHGARLGAYAVPFHAQLRMLLLRKVRTTLRNPAAIGMQILMPTVMGVVLGTVFQGIGKASFSAPQMQFVFILLTMLSLQSLPLMPVLIEERTFMKHETSERLYKESTHILTTMLVTVPLSLIGATIQTLIIYCFAELPYEFLRTILGWTLLLFFMFDALFQCVAAVAPDGEQAMTMATPWLVVFMLFNGLIVTKATAPVYLRWVFEISPTSYAMQSIFLTMKDSGGENNPLIKSCGYQHGHDFKGIAVIICMTIVLRLLQVLALKFLNNIQK